MKKGALTIVLITIVIFLVGCANSLQKQTENLSRALDGITPTDDPVHGTALVLLPSDVEIQKNYIDYREFGLGDVPRTMITEKNIKWMIAMIKNRFQFTADSIRKRGIFDSVSVAYQNGNPASFPIGDYDYIVFVDVDGWYLRAKNNLRALPISYDKNKLPLDSLHQQAKAVRSK